MKFDAGKYVNDFVKIHHAYEIYAYNQFKPALDQQVKAVSNHVKLYGGISKELADMLIRKEPIEKAYKSVYVNIGTIHAGWNLKQINQLGRGMSKSTPLFFSEKWRKLMELFYTNEAADRVSDVTETTRERVRQVLTDSEGMTISDRATYIENTLDDPDFNRARSLMIARTETTLAANKGASLGAMDADYETIKRWLAVEDRNTRPTHTDADGQEVAIDDNFTVGGYPAQYPGDVSLPAKECVNCRCTAAYVPVLMNGMPVLRAA